MSIATTSVKSELVLYLTREATILNKRYDVVKWVGANNTLTTADLANQPTLALVTNELYILNNVGGNNIVARMVNVDMTAINNQLSTLTTSINTLNTNVTALQQADVVLQNNIDALESNAVLMETDRTVQVINSNVEMGQKSIFTRVDYPIPVGYISKFIHFYISNISYNILGNSLSFSYKINKSDTILDLGDISDPDSGEAQVYSSLGIGMYRVKFNGVLSTVPYLISRKIMYVLYIPTINKTVPLYFNSSFWELTVKPSHPFANPGMNFSSNWDNTTITFNLRSFSNLNSIELYELDGVTPVPIEYPEGYTHSTLTEQEILDINIQQELGGGFMTFDAYMATFRPIQIFSPLGLPTDLTVNGKLIATTAYQTEGNGNNFYKPSIATALQTQFTNVNTDITTIEEDIIDINTELTQLENSISLKENIVPVRTIVLDSTNYDSVTGDIVITTPSNHIYDIEIEVAPNNYKSFSFPYTITGNTLTIKTQSGLLLDGMTVRIRCLEYIEDTEDLLGWQNIDWADFPNKKIYILDSNSSHANIMKTTMVNTANELGLGGDITSKIVIIPLGINNVPNDAIVALQSTTGAINYQQQAIDYLKPKNCLFFMPMGSNSNIEITGFTGFPDAMVLSGSTANGTTNSTAYGVGLEFIEYDEAISGDPTEESSYSNARLAAKYYVLLEFLHGLYVVGDPMPVITPHTIRLKMREHTNTTGYTIQRGYGVFDDIENAASELYGN